MKIELTEYELFLIEMALDQTLYSISDFGSPLYKRFEEIEVRIAKTRSSMADPKQEEKDILKRHS